MKVALCFSGKLGEWERTRDSILENILIPLKPDIFLFTWESEDYNNFIRFYKPLRFSILDYEKYKSQMNYQSINAWQGLKPMTFGMMKSFGVLKDYIKSSSKEYDLVIRLRPDLEIQDRIKRYEIRDSIDRKHLKLPFYEGLKVYDHEQELKKDIAFSFVYEKAILPDQINDQIAIAPVEVMNKYMNVFYKIEDVMEFMWMDGYPEYMCKVPESILTMFLKMNNIKYSPLTGSSKFSYLKTQLIK
jgi:hypothetical protein